MVTDREITLMTGLSIAEQRALVEENKRLRAALREIAEENIGSTAAISVYIARAALEDRT